MEQILTTIPNSPIGWIALIVAATAAGFAGYLFYTRQRDGADDRLINILKQTVEELERKVEKQDIDIRALSAKVNDLKSANDTLTKVLQGRDEATLAFQKEVLLSVSTVHETNGIVKQLESSFGKLADLISAHILAIETCGGQDKK